MPASGGWGAAERVGRGWGVLLAHLVPADVQCKPRSACLGLPHPSLMPALIADGQCKPDIRLTGHKVEGYGLSWNQQKGGFLLSGSDDAQICIWDVNATTTQNRVREGGAGEVLLLWKVLPSFLEGAKQGGVLCLGGWLV